MSLTIRQLATGLLILLLQGCSLAPAYLRPAMPVTDSFPAQQRQSAASTQDEEKSAAEIGWHDYFSDPALQQLITTALANNRDLRQSALAVESYQAQYRIQRAALLPTVNANVSGGKLRTQSGENMVTVETYSASVGITAYELDFFGRVKNLKDNALEQFLAMEETHRSARLSLVAEVARAYLTLLADREILAITEETLQNEEQSYALVEQRANGGHRHPTRPGPGQDRSRDRQGQSGHLPAAGRPGPEQSHPAHRRTHAESGYRHTGTERLISHFPDCPPPFPPRSSCSVRTSWPPSIYS